MRQRVKIVIKEEIVRELYAIAGEDAVQTAEPMKNHTTFRVGGPADYFVAPHTEEDILMEDNDILVVHKHAGMAVQNARMGQMDLEHALLNYLAKQTRAETPGQARTQIPYLAVVLGRKPVPDTALCRSHGT